MKPRRLLPIAAAVVVWWIGVPSGADDSGPGPAFYGPFRVPLVVVDVVVRGGDGELVTDLGADDFQVLEDGQPMEISHFARVALDPDGVPGAGEARFLALYFDDTNVPPRRRSVVLDQLESFFEGSYAPGLRTMVARFDGRLHIEAEFSEAPAPVREALARVRSRAVYDPTREADELVREMEAASRSIGLHERDSQQSAGGPPRGLSVQMIGDFSPRIDALAMASLGRNRGSLAGLSELISLLRGVPGRKTVLWVGSLETRTAEDLFLAWRQLLPSQASRAGAGVAMSSMRYDLKDELRGLADEASTHTVSFHGVGALGSARGARVSTETHSGVTASGSGRAGEGDPWAGQEAASVLSAMTGGRLLREGRGLGRELERVAAELGSYYSLAYIPEINDGAFHEISVEVSRPGVEVLHRRGRRAASESRAMADRLTAAALVGVASDALGVEVEARAQEPRGESSTMVPVVVRIPIGSLTLTPGTRRHEARVTIFSVVRDARGGLSDVHERTYPLDIPNERLLTAVGQRAEFVLGLVLQDGRQRVVVGVRDDGSMTESVAFLDLEVGAGREGEAR